MPDNPYLTALLAGHKPANSPSPAQLDADTEARVQKYSEKNGVDPELTRRLIGRESGGNNHAHSWAGARGLMQLGPGTVKRFGVTNPEDPDQNLDAGTRYLREHLDEFGDVGKALAAYNAGEGAVRKHGYEKVRGFSNLPKGDPRRGGYEGSTGQYVDKITEGYAGDGYHQSRRGKTFGGDVEHNPYFKQMTAKPEQEVRQPSAPGNTAESNTGAEDPFVERKPAAPVRVPVKKGMHSLDILREGLTEKGKQSGLDEKRAKAYAGDALAEVVRRGASGVTDDGKKPLDDSRMDDLVKHGYADVHIDDPAYDEPLKKHLEEQRAEQAEKLLKERERIEQENATIKSAIADPRKISRDIQWHFGINDMAEFSRLPKAKQRKIITLAAQAASADEKKKEQGVKLEPDLDYQNLMRARVGLGANPSLIDPRVPLKNASQFSFDPDMEERGGFLLHKPTFGDLVPQNKFRNGMGELRRAEGHEADRGPTNSEDNDGQVQQQIWNQIKTERASGRAQRNQGLITNEEIQNPDYFTDAGMRKDFSDRIHAYTEGQNERARLLSHFTDDERQQQAEVAQRIARDSHWWKGPDIGFTESGAQLLRTAAGLADLFFAGSPDREKYSDGIRRKALAAEEALRTVADVTAPLSKKQQAGRFVTKTLGDLTQLAAFTSTLGPVAGFGAQGFAQARGQNLSAGETAQETAKGAALGGVFELAPFLEGGGNSLLEKAGDLAKSSAVVGAGTYGVEKTFGATDEEARQAAVTNLLFHGVAKAMPELAGRTREAGNRVIASDKSPEWLREAVGKATGKRPVVVQSEGEDPRFASVYVDPKTREYVSREVDIEEASRFLQKERPARIVSEEQFDLLHPKDATGPVGAEPINRQITDGTAGTPVPAADSAPPEPPNEGNPLKESALQNIASANEAGDGAEVHKWIGAARAQGATTEEINAALGVSRETDSNEYLDLLKGHGDRTKIQSELMSDDVSRETGNVSRDVSQQESANAINLQPTPRAVAVDDAGIGDAAKVPEVPANDGTVDKPTAEPKPRDEKAQQIRDQMRDQAKRRLANGLISQKQFDTFEQEFSANQDAALTEAEVDRVVQQDHEERWGVDGHTWQGDKKPKAEPEKETKYEFSSTQVNLPKDIADEVRALASRIPDKHLAEDGREENPHTTVKFGLHTNNVDDVRAVLADEAPIKVTIGDVSTFPPSDSSNGAEVVKLDVDSPDLHRLNKKLSDALPHTDTFKYAPHITLAYVNKGQAKKYVGKKHSLQGREITVNSIAFSSRDGELIEIPLNGKAKAAADEAAKPAKRKDSLSNEPPGGFTEADRVGAKQPHQMSEEEFDKYHATLKPYSDEAGGVWAFDREVFLDGQEKAVYEALKDNRKVPAEVLNRFPDLKEWSETGENDFTREAAEKKRKRQEEIDNRPSVGTEEVDDDGRRIVYVDPARLKHDYENKKEGDISASYSADKIADKGTVRKPFTFEGKPFVDTGSGVAVELVPESQFKGETYTYNESRKLPDDHPDRYGYNGTKVKYQNKPYVLKGPAVRFRPGKEGTFALEGQQQPPKRVEQPKKDLQPMTADPREAVQGYLAETDQTIDDIRSDPDTHQSRDVTLESAEQIAEQLRDGGHSVTDADEERIVDAIHELYYEAHPEEAPQPAAEAKATVEAQKLSQKSERPDVDKFDGIPEELSTGMYETVKTERGLRATIWPAVVEAKDLVTSLDEGYPDRFQPRDRTRAASREQISRIANNLEPSFLGDSPKASEGRPLVVLRGDKYVVISGNGRGLGIREAYEIGRADAYAKFAHEQSNKKEKFKQPVYVGIITEVDSASVAAPEFNDLLLQFAREANESGVARMSAVEQAQDDANVITPDLMQKFYPSDDGDVNTAANRGFIRDFVQEVAGTDQRGQLLTDDGRLSVDGVNRVRNAIFAKAYGGSKEGLNALAKMAEDPDNNIRQITNALLVHAGGFAELKEHIANGTRHDLDISEDLVKAAAKLSALREDGMSVEHYLKQGSMFGEDLDTLQRRILVILNENKRSTRAINDILDNYLRGANAAGNPSQAGMWDAVNLTPSIEPLWDAAIKENQDVTDEAKRLLGIAGEATPKPRTRKDSGSVPKTDKGKQEPKGDSGKIVEAEPKPREPIGAKAVGAQFKQEQLAKLKEKGLAVGEFVEMETPIAGGLGGSESLRGQVKQAKSGAIYVQLEGGAEYSAFDNPWAKGWHPEPLQDEGVNDWQDVRKELGDDDSISGIEKLYSKHEELINRILVGDASREERNQFIGLADAAGVSQEDIGAILTEGESSQPQGDGALFRLAGENALDRLKKSEDPHVKVVAEVIDRRSLTHGTTEAAQAAVDDLIRALDKFQYVRSVSIPVSDYLNQPPLFDGVQLTTMQEGMLRAFERYSGKKRSIDKLVTEFLAEVQRGVKDFKEELPAPAEASQGALFKRGFHGSANTFDRFDLEHNGKGEGGQTFGWGLYFADKKEVAQHYRAHTSEKDFIRKVRDTYDEEFSVDDAETELQANPELNDTERNLLAALKADDWLGFDYPHQAVQAVLRDPDGFDASSATREAVQKFGRLYQVNLAPKESEYLLWDKPLALQSDEVKKALTEAGLYKETHTIRHSEKPVDTFGQDFYEDLVGEHLSVQERRSKSFRAAQEAASKQLLALGIRGIKYLDQKSRAAGDYDGSYNYVIFSADDVSIEAMYQTGGPAIETAELLPHMHIEQHGHRLKLDIAAREIVVRALNGGAAFEAGYDTALQSFTGAFFDQTVTKKVLTSLSSMAKANPDQAKHVRKLAAAIRDAAGTDGMVIVYNQERALVHEGFHRASALSGKKMGSRHAYFNELWAHPAMQKARIILEGRGYAKSAPLLVEEFAAYAWDGEYDKLGITADEAANFLALWFRSYEKENGKQSLEAFENERQQAKQIIRDAKNQRGQDAAGVPLGRRGGNQGEAIGNERGATQGALFRRDQGELFPEDSRASRRKSETDAIARSVEKQAADTAKHFKKLNADGPRHITLIACGASKLAHATEAKNLYQGDLFKKSRAFAERQSDGYFILSAMHDLVEPLRTLGPYERSLDSMGKREREAWGKRVVDSVVWNVPKGSKITLLAGATYAEPITEALKAAGFDVVLPLKGLAIGKQLQALGRMAEKERHLTPRAQKGAERWRQNQAKDIEKKAPLLAAAGIVKPPTAEEARAHRRAVLDRRDDFMENLQRGEERAWSEEEAAKEIARQNLPAQVFAEAERKRSKYPDAGHYGLSMWRKLLDEHGVDTEARSRSQAEQTRAHAKEILNEQEFAEAEKQANGYKKVFPETYGIHQFYVWRNALAKVGVDAHGDLNVPLFRAGDDEAIDPKERLFRALYRARQKEYTPRRASSRSLNLEQHSENRPDQDADWPTVSSDPGKTESSSPARSGPTAEAGSRSNGSNGVSPSGATARGEGSDQELREQTASGETVSSGSEHGPVSGPTLDARAPVDTRTTEAVDRAANRSQQIREKLAAQRAANSIPIQVGKLDNIRETLPFLHDYQQDDVHFAEKRFAKANGFGVMFTNGTGTGKTYSGAGVVARYVRRGKDNIVIIAPNDKISEQWLSSLKNLGVVAKRLDSTLDNGDEGVVLTTYANFYQNRTLVERKWDLVVPDEAHNLGSNEAGELTDAAQQLRAITFHPQGDFYRARMLLWDLHAEHEELSQKEEEHRAAYESTQDAKYLQLANDAHDRIAELGQEIQTKSRPIYEEVKNTKPEDRSRVVFLSATPFAYRKNIDWAQDYIFDWNDGQKPDGSRGYNVPSNREQFYIQHFGYRMRYNKLTEPDVDVNTDVMEQEFNEWLRKQGSLSRKTLDIDSDYSREFFLVDDAIGRKIDEGVTFLMRGGTDREYEPLYDQLKRNWKYLDRMFLLEAIKARHAVPIIKEHLALGRKVLVYHDFNKGGGFHPFKFDPNGSYIRVVNGRPVVHQLRNLVAKFENERADLVNLDFSGLHSPIITMENAFGDDALFFNGRVPSRARSANMALFNNDESKANLIVVQSDAGKEGMDAHDTSGEHQRVLINLGMPVRPTKSIQIEGRTRRDGAVSDAIYLYGTTGTNFETFTFASVISARAGTTENLAMGSEARALKEAFVDAYTSAVVNYHASENEGKGGKEADKRSQQAISPYERARTYYFGQRKRTSRDKSLEGIDYFATPEPVGFKMVEWARGFPGDSYLEPSGGHGAIARFFPPDSKRTIIEPSLELAARAGLVSDAKLITDSFENHHVVNKYDAIVMNPPFGKGGKTAVDHVRKAVTHLREGGRIVALIPEGPAADKQFEKFMSEEGSKNIILAADIKMPGVLFERAGTSVRTHVVVLEKQSDPDRARQVEQENLDFTNANNINDLFDRLEDVQSPARIPVPEEVKEPINAEAKSDGPQAGKTEKFDLKEFPHTQTGATMFVAKPRLQLDDFRAVNQTARRHKGHYSRYSTGGAIAGFLFPTAERRADFLAELGEVAEGVEGGSGLGTLGAPARLPANALALGTLPRFPVDPLPAVAAGKGPAPQQIIKTLNKALGKRTFTGSPGRNKGGSYNPASSKPLVRYSGDLDTTAHEIAHYLDDQYGLVSSWAAPRATSPFDGELIPHFSTHGASKTASLQEQRAEGVAEWIRALIANPGAARGAAPAFYDHFITTVPEDVRRALREFSNGVRAFAARTAVDRTASQIQMEPEKDSLREKLRTALHGDGYTFETTAADRLIASSQNSLHPLLEGIEAAKTIRGLGSIVPAQDAEVLVRLVAGTNDKFDDILENGLVNAQNGRVTGGGIKWLLEPLATRTVAPASGTAAAVTRKATSAEIEQDMVDTVVLMVNQRIIEKASQVQTQANDDIAALDPAAPSFAKRRQQIQDAADNRKARLGGTGGGIYADDKQAAEALFELLADPERLDRLTEAAKRYRQWMDSLLKYWVAKGRISQKSYDTIRDANQMYVAFKRLSDDIDERLIPKSSSKKLGSVYKGIHRFKGSTKRIVNPYFDLLDQTYRFYKEADRNEALRAFRELLTTDRKMYDGEVEDLSAIGSRVGRNERDAVRIFVDGREEKWKFERGIAMALKNWGEIDDQNIIYKILELPKKLTQFTVTHAPDFLVRNVIRDAFHRSVVSRVGSKPYDALKGWSSKDLSAYKLAGGGQAGFYLTSRNAYYKKMRTTIGELSNDRKTILSLPGKLLHGYGTLARGSELVGRMAEFKRAFKHAKDKLGYDDFNAELYAALQARDLIDYAVAGTIGRKIGRFVPFFNPAIQGGARLLEGIKESPAAFTARWTAYILVPSILCYALRVAMGDDDEHEQQPGYIRDMFWNIKIGKDLWLRVPRPFELGVFASGVERSLDLARGKKHPFEGYPSSLVNSITPFDEGTLAGPFKSIVEVIANHDFFRERAIVSPMEADKDLDLRKGNAHASRIGKALEKVLKVDARYIDHLIRSSTGGMGRIALDVSDIGRPDKRNDRVKWLNDAVGLFVSSPAYQARDVQFVLERARGRGELNSARMRMFGDQLEDYFSATSPAERDDKAALIRKTAAELRLHFEGKDSSPLGALLPTPLPKEKRALVDGEFNRLAYKPAFVGENIKIGEEDITIPTPTFKDYSQKVGEQLYEGYNQLIKHKRYRDLSDVEKSRAFDIWGDKLRDLELLKLKHELRPNDEETALALERAEARQSDREVLLEQIIDKAEETAKGSKTKVFKLELRSKP